jgi:isocitrate lyase
MNKLFVRLVAVALIPALLTNPALASGFAGSTPSPLSTQFHAAQQSLFEHEAITAVLSLVGAANISPKFTAKIQNWMAKSKERLRTPNRPLPKDENTTQNTPRGTRGPKLRPSPSSNFKRLWNKFSTLVPDFAFPLLLIGFGGSSLKDQNTYNGLEINSEVIHSYGGLLTPRARATIARITDKLGSQQEELMQSRDAYEAQVIANPDKADFLPADVLIQDNDGNRWTAEEIRTKDWKVSEEIPIPAELTEKPGLQLTGPAVQMNMLINGLNSNAVHYMIDFEDAQTDKHLKLYEAMQNVYDVLSGTIKVFRKGEKTYTPKDPAQWAKIIFRHRGPHLLNRQMTYKGQPVPATISDIVMTALNYHTPLHKLGKGLYFYSPKIQTWQEALWLDAIFREVEKELGIPPNTIKIFALHERIEHSLQQEEIMWVLRHRFIGPNVGRWDYLNSDIYLTHNDPKHVYPDPHTILMTAPHMDYYSKRNAAIAVKHGAIPIGGMAAQMKNPLRKDLDEVAVTAIRNDKTREHKQGYNWSWTATIDKEYVDAGNEALRQPRDPAQPVEYIPVDYTREARNKLLAVPPGKRTSLGVMVAIHYAIQYMYSQQSGENAAAIEDPISGIRFMNDFATYEIFWHWLWTMVHHNIRLEDVPADYSDKTFASPYFKTVYGHGAPYAGKKMGYALFNEILSGYEADIINTVFKKDYSAYDVSLWPSVFEIMRRQITAPKLANYGSPTLLALVDESNPIARHDMIEQLFKPGSQQAEGDRPITISVPDAWVRFTGGKEVPLKAYTLHDALQILVRDFSGLKRHLYDGMGQLWVNVLVNNEDKSDAVKTTILKEDDKIEIVPKIKGGTDEIIPAHVQEEMKQREDAVLALDAWMHSKRFQHTERVWTAKDVVPIQWSIPRDVAYGNAMARKMYSMLSEFEQNRRTGKKPTYIGTLGVINGPEVTILGDHGFRAAYVSGWQASLTDWSTSRTGPDLARYPYDTVPKIVERLVQFMRDQDAHQNRRRAGMTAKQLAATPTKDYQLPLFADGDTGHDVWEMMELFIEAGAAAVHIEDQARGVKKCGHMPGKVLVPMQEQINRLLEARAAADTMGSEVLLVARTDSEAANMLTGNQDVRDHAFILGTTQANIPKLKDVIDLAWNGWHQGHTLRLRAPEQQVQLLGKRWPALEKGIRDVWKVKGDMQAESNATALLSATWADFANLKTYRQAVEEELQKHLSEHPKTNNWPFAAPQPHDVLQAQLDAWRKETDPMEQTLSHEEAVEFAKSLGVEIPWDWEKPRTWEGYYQIQPGVEIATVRSKAFAPYADILWMEQDKPNLPEAKKWADGIREIFPHQFLAINNSPSFSWLDAELHKGRTVDEVKDYLRTYEDRLGDYGIGFHFITVAEHMTWQKWDSMAKAYQDDHMLAYARDTQEPEFDAKEAHGYRAIEHQNFAGADFRGHIMDLIARGASSTKPIAHGHGQTGTAGQFAKKRISLKPGEPVFALPVLVLAAYAYLQGIPFAAWIGPIVIGAFIVSLFIVLRRTPRLLRANPLDRATGEGKLRAAAAA